MEFAHFRNALHMLSQHYIFKLPTHYVVDGIYKMVAQAARFHTGFFGKGGGKYFRTLQMRCHEGRHEHMPHRVRTQARHCWFQSNFETNLT